jgi:hypothetical protein
MPNLRMIGSRATVLRWGARNPPLKVQGSGFNVSVCLDYPLFSLVPEPIWNTIRGGGAAHQLFRAMPVIAE